MSEICIGTTVTQLSASAKPSTTHRSRASHVSGRRSRRDEAPLPLPLPLTAMHSAGAACDTCRHKSVPRPWPVAWLLLLEARATRKSQASARVVAFSHFPGTDATGSCAYLRAPHAYRKNSPRVRRRGRRRARTRSSSLDGGDGSRRRCQRHAAEAGAVHRHGGRGGDRVREQGGGRPGG